MAALRGCKGQSESKVSHKTRGFKMKTTDKARVVRLRKAIPECIKLSDNAVLFLIKKMRIRKTEIDELLMQKYLEDVTSS